MRARIGTVLGMALLLAACDLAVEGDVEVPAGSERERGATLVNGEVYVGDGARVRGGFRTVNGDIEIGREAEVGDLVTVNGRVRIGRGARVGSVDVVNGGLRADEGVRIGGSVAVVNGGVRMAHDSVVDGDLVTVTGGVELESVRIEGDLAGVLGDFTLSGATVVTGALRIERGEDLGDWDADDPRLQPRVVLGAGTVVRGGVHFEHAGELWVHEEAEVGPISGVEAQRFSGDRPGAEDPAPPRTDS